MTAEELHQKIYQKGVFARWAEILHERWDDKIADYHVIKTGDLARSLKRTIVSNPSDYSQKAVFTFNRYGRFVDMGVGRGVNISKAREMRTVHARALGLKNPYRPKKWYSKTLYGEVKKLAEIIAKEYGASAAEMVKSNIDFLPIILEI